MMGRTQLKLTLVGSRSSHNSAQDLIDRGNWLHLMGKIKELVDDDRYKSLGVEMDMSDW